MESLNAVGTEKETLKYLAPTLSSQQLNDLKAYLQFSERYQKILNDQLVQQLMTDPILGPIIKAQTDEQRATQNEHSAKMQREAVLKGKWDQYNLDLMQQGMMYAKLGLDYAKWYEVVIAYKEMSLPLLWQDHADDPELIRQILRGMGRMMDHAMHVIAEAFFLEKNRVIYEQQKKQELLLATLETNHAKLQESEERLRALFEASSDHIFMINKEGTIAFINHVAPDRTKEDVVGTNLLDFQTDAHRPVVEAAIRNVITTGNRDFYETPVQSPSGGTITYASSIGPVYNGDEVVGAVVVARDITQRKRMERELKELNEQLEDKVRERTAALEEQITEKEKAEENVSRLNKELEKQLKQLEVTNEELESFSYTVSHDLRAPLRAIDGFAKVLDKKLEGKLDADQDRYLGIIKSNVQKMGTLIDDLLAFSRMGRLEKSETLFDFKDLVQRTFAELTQGEGKPSVELVLKDMPNLKADREMMRHVVSNLLGNAIKFSSVRDNPQVEVGATEKDGETIYYFKDNGVGFEMEYVGKIFSIFQRLHSDEEFEGTGVGLAIVQRIVHRHGGQVWAEGKPDEGATFYMSIPNTKTEKL